MVSNCAFTSLRVPARMRGAVSPRRTQEKQQRRPVLRGWRVKMLIERTLVLADGIGIFSRIFSRELGWKQGPADVAGCDKAGEQPSKQTVSDSAHRSRRCQLTVRSAEYRSGEVGRFRSDGVTAQSSGNRTLDCCSCCGNAFRPSGATARRGS